MKNKTFKEEVETFLKLLFKDHKLTKSNEFIYPMIEIKTDFTCNAILQKEKFENVQQNLQEELQNINKTKSQTKIILNLTKPIIEECFLILRALTYPFGNIILEGQTSIGKYTLTNFISLLKNYRFILINPKNQLKNIPKKNYYRKFLSSALLDCIYMYKPTVIFLDIQKRLKDFIYLESLFNNYNFNKFFNKEELNDLYNKISKIKNIDFDNKLLIYNEICLILKYYLHFVISIDDDNTFDYNLLPSYYRFKLLNDSIDFYENSSNDIIHFKQYELIQNLIPNNLYELISKIHQIIIQRFPIIKTNHFYDFVHYFMNFIIKNSEKLKNDQIKFKNSLLFIDKIKTEINEINEKISSIKTILQTFNQDDKLLKQNFLEQKEEITTKISKIEDEERQKTVETKKLGDDINQLQQELINYKTNINHYYKIIEDNKDKILFDLKEYSNESTIKTIMNMYSIFIFHNSRYEIFGKRLLKDPNFINLISKIDLESFDSEFITKAKPIFNHSQNLTFENSSIEILFNWIDNAYRYISLNEKIKEKTKDYEDKMVNLQDFLNDSLNEKTLLTNHSNDLDKEYELFQNSIKKRNELEQEKTIFESRKRKFDIIFKGLDSLYLKWKFDLEEIERNINNIIGNSLIVSIFLAYFGIMSKNEQNEIFELIFQEFNKYKININVNDPLHFISTELKLNNELIDSNYYINDSIKLIYKLITNVKRTPLIIDPDGIIFSLIKNAEKDLIVTSILSNDLNKIIFECTKYGKTLILFDVDKLTYEVELILQINESKKVSNLISMKKVYLFTNVFDINKIPINLSSRTIIINSTYFTLSSIKKQIQKCFFDYFEPELIPRYISSLKNEIVHINQINLYENETLNIISNIIKEYENNQNFDFINSSNDKIIDQLLQSKESYFATNNISSNLSIIKSEIKMNKNIFKNEIQLCISFWESLTRFMYKINSNDIYSLNLFLKSIKNSINSSGFHQNILNEGQHVILNSLLIQNITKSFLSMITFKESFCFLFITGFLLKISQNKIKRNEFDLILKHINEEYNNKIDFHGIDFNSNDYLNQLKFTNVLNVFNFIYNFVIETFGNEFIKNLSYFKIESFNITNSKTPILIKIKGKRDPTNLLDHYINMRNKWDSTISFSLINDYEHISSIENVIKESIKNDKIIIFHYTKSNIKISSLIYNIFNEYQNDSTTTSKLILLCNTTKGLSKEFLLKCEQFNYEDFPSIKTQLLEFYQHHYSYIQSSSNPKLMKKLTFCISLIYSLLNYRNFIKPIGFYDLINIDEIQLKNLMLKIKDLFDSINSNDVQIRNISDFIYEKYFGCSNINHYDLKKIKLYINSFVNNGISEDEFSLVNNSSDEFDIWKLSNDFQLNNLDRIPLFPKCDILQMNKYISIPFLYWNLSRWISQPFKLLYKVNNDINIIKVNQKNPKYSKNKLPNILVITKDKFITPIQLFFYDEIILLNNIITFIRKQLINLLNSKEDERIFKNILKNSIPFEWCNIIKYFGTKKLSEFLKYLKEKEDLLMNWDRNKLIPSSINIKLISSLESLLISYLNEIAIQRKLLIENLNYKFFFDGDKNDIKGGIVLDGLYIVGANWDLNANKIIQPNAKTLPISKLPKCKFVIMEKVTKELNTFNCPIYRTLILNDVKYENIKDTNLQWHIPLKADVNEQQLIANGVEIVCQVPDYF